MTNNNTSTSASASASATFAFAFAILETPEYNAYQSYRCLRLEDARKDTSKLMDKTAQGYTITEKEFWSVHEEICKFCKEVESFEKCIGEMLNGDHPCDVNHESGNDLLQEWCCIYYNQKTLKKEMEEQKEKVNIQEREAKEEFGYLIN